LKKKSGAIGGKDFFLDTAHAKDAATQADLAGHGQIGAQRGVS